MDHQQKQQSQYHRIPIKMITSLPTSSLSSPNINGLIQQDLYFEYILCSEYRVKKKAKKQQSTITNKVGLQKKLMKITTNTTTNEQQKTSSSLSSSTLLPQPPPPPPPSRCNSISRSSPVVDDDHDAEGSGGGKGDVTSTKTASGISAAKSTNNGSKNGVKILNGNDKTDGGESLSTVVEENVTNGCGSGESVQQVGNDNNIDNHKSKSSSTIDRDHHKAYVLNTRKLQSCIDSLDVMSIRKLRHLSDSITKPESVFIGFGSIDLDDDEEEEEEDYDDDEDHDDHNDNDDEKDGDNINKDAKINDNKDNNNRKQKQQQQAIDIKSQQEEKIDSTEKVVVAFNDNVGKPKSPNDTLPSTLACVKEASVEKRLVDFFSDDVAVGDGGGKQIETNSLDLSLIDSDLPTTDKDRSITFTTPISTTALDDSSKLASSSSPNLFLPLSISMLDIESSLVSSLQPRKSPTLSSSPLPIKMVSYFDYGVQYELQINKNEFIQTDELVISIRLTTDNGADDYEGDVDGGDQNNNNNNIRRNDYQKQQSEQFIQDQFYRWSLYHCDEPLFTCSFHPDYAYGIIRQLSPFHYAISWNRASAEVSSSDDTTNAGDRPLERDNISKFLLSFCFVSTQLPPVIAKNLVLCVEMFSHHTFASGVRFPVQIFWPNGARKHYDFRCSGLFLKPPPSLADSSSLSASQRKFSTSAILPPVTLSSINLPPEFRLPKSFWTIRTGFGIFACHIDGYHAQYYKQLSMNGCGGTQLAAQQTLEFPQPSSSSAIENVMIQSTHHRQPLPSIKLICGVNHRLVVRSINFDAILDRIALLRQQQQQSRLNRQRQREDVVGNLHDVDYDDDIIHHIGGVGSRHHRKQQRRRIPRLLIRTNIRLDFVANQSIDKKHQLLQWSLMQSNTDNLADSKDTTRTSSLKKSMPIELDYDRSSLSDSNVVDVFYNRCNSSLNVLWYIDESGTYGGGCGGASGSSLQLALKFNFISQDVITMDTPPLQEQYHRHDGGDGGVVVDHNPMYLIVDNYIQEIVTISTGSSSSERCLKETLIDSAFCLVTILKSFKQLESNQSKLVSPFVNHTSSPASKVMLCTIDQYQTKMTLFITFNGIHYYPLMLNNLSFNELAYKINQLVRAHLFAILDTGGGVGNRRSSSSSKRINNVRRRYGTHPHDDHYRSYDQLEWNMNVLKLNGRQLYPVPENDGYSMVELADRSLYRCDCPIATERSKSPLSSFLARNSNHNNHRTTGGGVGGSGFIGGANAEMMMKMKTTTTTTVTTTTKTIEPELYEPIEHHRTVMIDVLLESMDEINWKLKSETVLSFDTKFLSYRNT